MQPERLRNSPSSRNQSHNFEWFKAEAGRDFFDSKPAVKGNGIPIGAAHEGSRRGARAKKVAKNRAN